jgi:hypothetical protein
MAGKGMHDNSVEQCCNVILTRPAISPALVLVTSFVPDLLGHDACRCRHWAVGPIGNPSHMDARVISDRIAFACGMVYAEKWIPSG